mmetsp:Transcript_26154/g.36121  ORF Transcript_26154/g.36121 Transcript_26154/m.36121 type:complete len:133 (-) Transcript_26154:192-590(-)|eukprot:CAMPEP_0196575984 /NCGR_PEP_ID=MMETSP1081-20130531/5362_1 /TAXON_ID=36882 /ORGANISM="Pyramimonas amylifera, Strain CCMP720" /LENGTH=132 /DNA_ID=CAMNT_0041894459 /DNA_START=226 /DNA_END=624 /DNA_ORIENTATION=+
MVLQKILCGSLEGLSLVRNAASQSILTRDFHVGTPSYAKKGAKVVDNSEPAGTGKCDLKVATGLNIMKGGADPELGSTESYPDWLWTLTDPKPSLVELTRKNFPDLTLDEQKRLVKLQNREDIKSKNRMKAK